MAAQPYGALVTITATTPATAQTLTALLQSAIPGFRQTTLSNLSFRAHFDNVDRIFLVIDGRDSDFLTPSEPARTDIALGRLSTDFLAFRAANAGDRLYIAGVEP